MARVPCQVGYLLKFTMPSAAFDPSGNKGSLDDTSRVHSPALGPQVAGGAQSFRWAWWESRTAVRLGSAMAVA